MAICVQCHANVSKRKTLLGHPMTLTLVRVCGHGSVHESIGLSNVKLNVSTRSGNVNIKLISPALSKKYFFLFLNQNISYGYS